jgi:hypothetical protein
MGGFNLYHPQKGWYSSIHFGLPRIEQANTKKTLSNTKNPGLTIKIGRFSVCNFAWFKYGLLPYRTQSKLETFVHLFYPGANTNIKSSQWDSVTVRISFRKRFPLLWLDSNLSVHISMIYSLQPCLHGKIISTTTTTTTHWLLLHCL